MIFLTAEDGDVLDYTICSNLEISAAAGGGLCVCFNDMIEHRYFELLLDSHLEPSKLSILNTVNKELLIEHVYG